MRREYFGWVIILFLIFIFSNLANAKDINAFNGDSLNFKTEKSTRMIIDAAGDVSITNNLNLDGELLGVSDLTVSNNLEAGISTLSQLFSMLNQASTPSTPTAGRTIIYSKTDGKVYKGNSIEGETRVGIDVSSSNDNRAMISSGVNGDSIEETPVIIDPSSGDISGVNDITVTGIADFNGVTDHALELSLSEIATPATPNAGKVSLYAKSTGSVYVMSSSGVEQELGSASKKVAYLKDVKASGTDGGSSSSDTVHTRDLNTLTGDTSFISLGSNQWTLTAGTYFIECTSPTWKAASHQAFIYNVTDASEPADLLGSVGRDNNGGDDQGDSTIKGTITIASSKQFEVRHWTQIGQATSGLGRAPTGGTNTRSEVYTQCMIEKE